MTNFMRIKNPELQETGQMFGPSRPKFVPEETEAVDPIDLPAKAPEVEEERANLTCEVCGFVAKSEFGLKAHSRKHK